MYQYTNINMYWLRCRVHICVAALQRVHGCLQIATLTLLVLPENIRVYIYIHRYTSGFYTLSYLLPVLCKHYVRRYRRERSR